MSFRIGPDGNLICEKCGSPRVGFYLNRPVCGECGNSPTPKTNQIRSVRWNREPEEFRLSKRYTGTLARLADRVALREWAEKNLKKK